MLKRHRPLCFKHLLVQDSDTESDDASNYQMIQPRRRYGNSICIGKDKKKGKEKLNFGEDLQISKPTMGPNFDPGISLGDTTLTLFRGFPSSNTEDIVKLAKEYQKHMKKTPIPRARLSHAVAVNWQGLARSMKNLYGQPLHYLTHRLCKQWDKSRFGGDDGEKPLECIFSGNKAEAIIWEVEAVHRVSTSHIYLANLWLADPDFHAFVDEVLPCS